MTLQEAYYAVKDSLSNSRFMRKLRRKMIPKTQRQPWKGSMMLECCGGGERIKYPGYMSSSVKLQWVSREKTETGEACIVRHPQERTTVFDEDGGFEAAGKHYRDIRQLHARMDETGTWCRDKYGREVLYLIERFPCFDSYDAMYEDRYYRWFFLREDGRLTRVFASDAHWEVYVTDDVERLELDCWEEMQELDYFDTGAAGEE